MNRAGVYIHIPFCRSRCSYCDFATSSYDSSSAQRYVSAVAKEVREWNEVEAPPDVDTIYFGGGTPALLLPAQVDRILQAVGSRFNVIDAAEITMEMNPASFGENSYPRAAEITEAAERKTGLERKELDPPAQALKDFHTLGINRASFGAQTFDDEQLRLLGRTHAADDIGKTFHHLRDAGFTNINFDLIAGLPGQTLAGWEHNLDEALALRPEHLSLYLLDLHEGTPLADQIRRGLREKPDDDLAAEMYRVMIERVCAGGYEHYEISNFCLSGFAARHNTKYWTGESYYGFGCSAHSYDGDFHRWANQRDTARYIEAIERGGSPIVERTELSERDARAESIFLGLRMMRGIDMGVYQARFGADLGAEYRDDLARFGEAGLIEVSDGLLRLTRRGALLSNEVFSAFV